MWWSRRCKCSLSAKSGAGDTRDGVWEAMRMKAGTPCPSVSAHEPHERQSHQHTVTCHAGFSSVDMKVLLTDQLLQTSLAGWPPFSTVFTFLPLLWQERAQVERGEQGRTKAKFAPHIEYLLHETGTWCKTYPTCLPEMPSPSTPVTLFNFQN